MKIFPHFFFLTKVLRDKQIVKDSSGFRITACSVSIRAITEMLLGRVKNLKQILQDLVTANMCN